MPPFHKINIILTRSIVQDGWVEYEYCGMGGGRQCSQFTRLEFTEINIILTRIIVQDGWIEYEYSGGGAGG